MVCEVPEHTVPSVLASEETQTRCQRRERVSRRRQDSSSRRRESSPVPVDSKWLRCDYSTIAPSVAPLPHQLGR